MYTTNILILVIFYIVTFKKIYLGYYSFVLLDVFHTHFNFFII